MLNTDVFVLRDDCQFVRKHKYPSGKIGPSYQAHAPIKHTHGLQYLMVHTHHEGLRAISQTRISYQNNWLQTSVKTLQYIFQAAPHFDDVFADLRMILSHNFTYLSDLNIATTCWGILKLAGFKNITMDHLTIARVNNVLKKQKTFRLQTITRATRLSCFAAFPSMSPSEKILAIIQELGAHEDYCGGTAIAAYMDQSLFQKNGVKVTVQEWTCKEYPQQFMKSGFIPNLSIIDLLMNVTPDKAIGIIQG